MTNKKNPSPNSTYHVSPTGKIHADSCRYCQADKEGWQKLDSLESGLEKNYQLCRLCCPSQEEIISSSSPSDTTENQDLGNSSDDTPIMTQEKPENQTESDASSTPSTEEKEKTTSESETSSTPSTEEKEKTTSESDNPPSTENKATNDENKKKKSKKKGENKSENKTEDKAEDNPENKKEKDKSDSAKAKKDKKSEKKEPPAEKKRYKILAGNGCHQAIAEVLGILIPPAEGEKSFRLILPDGTQLEATFKNSRLAWLAHNKPELLGQHWFRGYPKMKDDKLVSLQIVAWDGTMPTNPRGFETWEFTGVWTLQKNVTIQRSMMLDDVRKIAKETGFIKKFKYTFINSFDWVKNKKLWAGYVYKILCQRKGDVLEIKKVIPYACPRIKPVPKQAPPRGDKPFNKGDKPFNKGDKPFNKGDKPKFIKK